MCLNVHSFGQIIARLFRGVFLPVEITWIQAGLSCTGIFVKKIIFALTEVVVIINFKS